jgi:AcrR family transcriptional regulator
MDHRAVAAHHGQRQDPEEQAGRVSPAELAAARPGRSWQPGPQRRAQLAGAAAQQFHRLGFYQVSMADVAAAVGLTAPAIYRHYKSKEDLLVAAITDALDTVEQALARAEGAGVPEFMVIMAGAAVARRELWILLQREMRHLSPAQRQPLAERFSRIVRPFATLISGERTDLPGRDARLLTTAVLAALASASVYRSRMPERDQQLVLAAAATAACQARWAAGTESGHQDEMPARSAASVSVPDRGAEILDTAIRLFAARGYRAVSLDDIGAELGMAGPSLLYYFATKADILVAAFARATGWLAAQRGVPSGDRDGPARSLAELAAAYIDLAVRERLLFGVYVWEAVNLPPEAGRRIRSGLDADIGAWCDALADLRPELTGGQRLALVHAARAVVHDVVRLGHWHGRPDITVILRAVVSAVLAAPLERKPPLERQHQ